MSGRREAAAPAAAEQFLFTLAVFTLVVLIMSVVCVFLLLAAGALLGILREVRAGPARFD